MDVNSVNPILASFANILPQIGFQKVEKKGLSLAGSALTNKGILINISMVGPFKGAILIGMEIDAAKQFASRMMMGMDVVDFDSLAQSALSEMANMVCANACTNFAQAGIVGLDISPPTLLIGQGGSVMLAAPKVIVVNFLIDGIPVDMYIGLT